MGRKNEWVDSLKGTAVCAVILVHSGGGKLPSVLGKIGAAGARGVELFFIISAFLTFASLERWSVRETIGGSKKNRYGVWLIKKIMRIIPLYYLAIIVYLAVQGTGHRYWLGSLESISPANVISHLFFVNGFFPHYINSILGVEWYLADLVLFYVLSVFLFRIIKSAERAFLFTALSVPVCYGVTFVLKHTLIIQDAEIGAAFYGNFCFVSELPVWMIGILLYYIWKEEWFHRIKGSAFISYSILLLSLYRTVNLVLNPNNMTLFLFGLCFAGIIVSQEIRPCPLLVNRIFGFLGKESYGIYLTHFLLIDLYNRFFSFSTGIQMLDWLLAYGIVTLLSCVLAVVLRRLVEQPMLRLVNPDNKEYRRENMPLCLLRSVMQKKQQRNGS